MNKSVLGVALVGLGKYSTGELAPAFAETKYCKLAGIVTGSHQKANEWKEKYTIPEKNIYNYNNFDDIKDNPDIDVVYIVLPNALHAEYVIRAAKAGKHVICEKPMAITLEECDAMMQACEQAGVRLAIGYRLHFEPHNLEVMRLGQHKIYGELRQITASFGMAEAEGWRLDAALSGGGPLMDVGIYCVQAARYTSGLEPTSVTAKAVEAKDKSKFKNIEESIAWTLHFPNGLKAECNCSYVEEMDQLHVDAENGWFELKPAFEYSAIKGNSSNGEIKYEQVKQQARHMDGVAKSIIENSEIKVNGEMGKQDLKIIKAIYQAAKEGREITIK